MIKNLIYLCPLCEREDQIIQHKKYLYCPSCHTRFPFWNNLIEIAGKKYKLPELYDLIRRKLALRLISEGPVLRISGKAILRQGIKKVTFCGNDKQCRLIEVPEEVDRGVMIFEQEKLIFRGGNSTWVFPSREFTGFTTNSKYLEFKLRDKPFYQVYFRDESPLKYEELFKIWYHILAVNGQVIEHQPQIKVNLPTRSEILLAESDVQHKFREKFFFSEFLLHLFIGLTITNFFKWYSKLKFINRELIPRNGPCIIVANHESYLDPILISTLSPRRIGFFTKSTSFASKVLQPIFRAYRSLPNKRYQTDPLVIRQALRRLKNGHCIGIFPEGERTWDGRLRSFKYSTMRLLLSAQVPIVLLRISGGFEVLPRWSHKIRRHDLKIIVERCFSILPGSYDIQQLKSELESFYKNESV